MSYLILDTETTSKYPSEAECLQVAIIDHTGTVLLDTLVRPERAKKWPAAQDIHGIRPSQVFAAGVPTLAEVTRQVADILQGREVVIYNAGYDTQVLSEAFALGTPAAVHCAMLAFSEHPEVRVWNNYHGNYRWQSLATAADYVGHQWQGKAHSALADCYAARDVWAWLTDPAERVRLEAAQQARREAKELAWHIRDVFVLLERAEEERQRQVNWTWERAHYPAMGVCERRDILPDNLRAEKSANVFALHLVGTTARVWNKWGEKLLALPRYYRLAENVPATLTNCAGMHLLPAAQRIQPAALLVYAPDDAAPHEWLDAHKLYKKRSLRRGVHYVPVSPGYDPWPEGHYSKTTLQRQFKLKPADIEQLKPGYLRRVVRGSSYENEYLLYPYTPPTDEKPS